MDILDSNEGGEIVAMFEYSDPAGRNCTMKVTRDAEGRGMIEFGGDIKGRRCFRNFEERNALFGTFIRECEIKKISVMNVDYANGV
jgi:hypothetical protein